ncbi:MAG: hypothetical protein UY04_C0018G0007 [Parcubacteria group bacterium GW2011_GWA2_47_7]|nr:MAG: hypothetical protein UY04_C0018G0007 [Parcubacteria group bacterium GW2011_GWA2_47_7]
MLIARMKLVNHIVLTDANLIHQIVSFLEHGMGYSLILM